MNEKKPKVKYQGIDRFRQFRGEVETAQLQTFAEELGELADKYPDFIVAVAIMGCLDGAESEGGSPHITSMIREWHERAAEGKRSWELS